VTLPDLLERVEKASELGDPQQETYLQLAQEAADLADMVGWAAGPIDSQGRFLARLEQMDDALRAKQGRSGGDHILALCGALVQLRSAIHRHDRDLGGSAADDDYEEI